MNQEMSEGRLRARRKQVQRSAQEAVRNDFSSIIAQIRSEKNLMGNGKRMVVVRFVAPRGYGITGFWEYYESYKEHLITALPDDFLVGEESCIPPDGNISIKWDADLPLTQTTFSRS